MGQRENLNQIGLVSFVSVCYIKTIVMYDDSLLTSFRQLGGM